MEPYRNPKTIDKTINEIKTDWFDKHQARIIQENESTTIYWRQPNTNAYAVKYVLSGYNIFVSGDVGDAVYQLTCPATLETIKNFDVYYLTSKLVAVSGRQYNFNNETAENEFKAYWTEQAECLPEHEDKTVTRHRKKLYDDLLRIIKDCGTFNEWTHRFYEYYLHTPIDMDHEYLSDLGKETPRSIIGFWVGLNHIANQHQKPASQTSLVGTTWQNKDTGEIGIVTYGEKATANNGGTNTITLKLENNQELDTKAYRLDLNWTQVTESK